MRVVFSTRAFAAILAETTEKITTETGGLLLGIVQDDSWYVVEAIDPGPKSIFEVAYFEYDQKYTQHLINKIANLYKCKLDLIGLWHRHPGSFDQFSSTDDGTNAKYAYMRKEGAISGLVNIDPSFRLTMYHVEQPCRYRKVAYVVGDDLIPNEFLAYKSPDRFYDLMQRRLSPERSHNTKPAYTRTISLESFMRFIAPVIEEAQCTDVETNISIVDSATPDKLTDAVIDDIAFMSDKVGIQFVAEIKDQYLIISQEALDATTKLYFMDSVKKKSVVFSYEDKTYLYHSGMFEEAAQKAKETRIKEETAIETRGRRAATPPEIPARIKCPNGIVDTVKSIIKFYRNEEPTDGD